MSVIQKIEEVKKKYKEEFGISKLQKVESEIYNSSIINKTFNNPKNRSVPPRGKDLVTPLNGMTYFIFGSANRMLIGAIFVLERWNNEINIDNCIYDDYELEKLFIEVVRETGMYGKIDL